jgi:small-conductance mechanosensitive channel
LDPLTALFEAGGIAVGAVVIEELLSRLTARAAKSAGVAPNEVRQVQDALIIIFVAIAVVAIAGVLGVSSFFTTLGISAVAGLAATLALQTTLQNIIAGIFMIRDHTIRLGDSIEIGGMKGHVVRLGFRTAWLKDDTGSIVVVGNNTLMNGPFVNHTAAERLEGKIPTTPR